MLVSGRVFHKPYIYNKDPFILSHQYFTNKTCYKRAEESRSIIEVSSTSSKTIKTIGIQQTSNYPCGGSLVFVGVFCFFLLGMMKLCVFGL